MKYVNCEFDWLNTIVGTQLCKLSSTPRPNAIFYWNSQALWWAVRRSDSVCFLCLGYRSLTSLYATVSTGLFSWPLLCALTILRVYHIYVCIFVDYEGAVRYKITSGLIFHLFRWVSKRPGKEEAKKGPTPLPSNVLVLFFYLLFLYPAFSTQDGHVQGASI